MPQALAGWPARVRVAIGGRRTQAVEGASPAPEPAVAAVKPRHLAPSDNSPCHDRRKPEGAQSLGGSRATKGSHAQRGARRPAAAPGIKLTPGRLMPGLGGAGWRWRPQPNRDAPTRRQPAGGQRPGAPGRRRGKPGWVEHSEDQGISRSRCPVQRVRSSRFPAPGTVREADRGRGGAPPFFGTRATSRSPSSRPTVQGGERLRWTLAASRPFAPPSRPPLKGQTNRGNVAIRVINRHGDSS